MTHVALTAADLSAHIQQIVDADSSQRQAAELARALSPFLAIRLPAAPPWPGAIQAEGIDVDHLARVINQIDPDAAMSIPALAQALLPYLNNVCNGHTLILGTSGAGKSAMLSFHAPEEPLISLSNREIQSHLALIGSQGGNVAQGAQSGVHLATKAPRAAPTSRMSRTGEQLWDWLWQWLPFVVLLLGLVLGFQGFQWLLAKAGFAPTLLETVLVWWGFGLLFAFGWPLRYWRGMQGLWRTTIPHLLLVSLSGPFALILAFPL